MKAMPRLLPFLISLGLTGCGKQPAERSQREGPGEAGPTNAYTIAVIPKGTTHEFWKSIHAGAVKAERELNQKGVRTEIIWKGPLKEDDRDQQIQVVENFMSRRVSGIVLAPQDSKQMVPPVRRARDEGIPSVIIDSNLDKDELAKRLKWHLPQVDRLLAMHHGSKLEQLESAFQVMGKRLVLGIEDVPQASESSRAGRRRRPKHRARRLLADRKTAVR